MAGNPATWQDFEASQEASYQQQHKLRIENKYPVTVTVENKYPVTVTVTVTVETKYP